MAGQDPHTVTVTATNDTAVSVQQKVIVRTKAKAAAFQLAQWAAWDFPKNWTHIVAYPYTFRAPEAAV